MDMPIRWILLFSLAFVTAGVVYAAGARYGPYRPIALDAHTGEVPGTSPSAGATTVSFALPAGRTGEALLISGATTAPVVTIVSPSGARLTTPATPGTTTTSAGARMRATIDGDGRSVRVILRRPPGGTWVVTRRTGSSTVTEVLGAVEHARH